MRNLIRNLIRSKTGLIGLILVAVVVFTAIFAALLAPHSPTKQSLKLRLTPPFWEEKGVAEYPLGTDQLGRDMLSRLIYGSRISLQVGLLGTLAAGIMGVFLGTLSGYYGGRVDSIIMRIADIQLAFPFILLAIFIVAVLGSGLQNIIIVATISSWVRYARLVRGEILSIKQLEYIEAIRSLGAKDTRIMFFHVLPNVVSPIIVIGTLEMARIVQMEASLSFLGLGVPAEIPTWGRMLAEGRTYIISNPWLAIFPGLTITLLILGINLLGDWLRDYLDPNLRNT